MSKVSGKAEPAAARRKQAHEIDETDRRILRALQQDARLTTVQLAEQ
ncbi:MAG: hypothetical protein V7608_3592, partial [Hyphomicrobiales bacterium]